MPRNNQQRGGRGGGGGGRRNRGDIKDTSKGGFLRKGRGGQREEEEGYRNRNLPQTHKLSISGFAHSVNIESLRTFLVAQTEANFITFQGVGGNNQVIATVDTRAEANALQNKSGTLMFGNKKLIIKYLEPRNNHQGPPGKSGGGNIVEERKALELFISKHYDPDSRMLNLSNLSAYIPKITLDFNDRSFMLSLFHIMSQKCPDIITVMFDRNKIKRLTAFASIRDKYSMRIQNISLDSNEISDFDELAHLKSLNLRELVLSNNPVCTGIDEVQYKIEVVRRLPDLGYLDTKKIKAGADDHPKTQLPPIMGNFFDLPAHQNIADAFLQKYFEAFDNDRNQLVDAYADQSCFSVSIIPVNSKPQGRGGSSFKRGDKFVPYTALDRNFKTATSLETRTTTLKIGPTHIVGTLLDLPVTKHDYESLTVDCFISKLGTFEMLSVFVHGSFQESGKTQRSFSRVFLLVPPAPGTKAHAAGWQGVIINDQMYVRYYTPKRVKPPPPQVVPSAEQAQADKELQEKRDMVIRLSQLTNMTLVFAEQCVAGNNWNYEAALANFQDLKNRGMIPPEAFQQK